MFTRVAVLAAATVFSTACAKKTGDEAPRKQEAPPIKAALAKASLTDTPKQIVLTGVVAAHQRAEVTADTQGKVIAVMVERGKTVKFGDPVVQLDVANAALGAREAQANLASARAQRALAEEECRRTKELFDKGAITKSEYDRQLTQCTAALQQVSAAEARTAMMAKGVADGIVRAPFGGLVTEKNVTPGEWVSPGRALFTLVDSNPLHIDLSVPEAAVRAIEKGQRVSLTAVALDEDLATGSGDTRFKSKKTVGATVTRIGGEIGRTRAMIVEAEIDKDSGLVPGMFAEAAVAVGTPVKRVVVPAAALSQRGKQVHIFAVTKGGVLEDRIAQVGPEVEPGKFALLSGLAENERYVAAVTKDIADGVRVVE
jgi:membrane fusion protein, multidrug efflux system